jgi:hypothetical protein
VSGFVFIGNVLLKIMGIKNQRLLPPPPPPPEGIAGADREGGAEGETGAERVTACMLCWPRLL